MRARLISELDAGNDQARTQLYVFSHCSASSLAFQRCRSPSQKSLPCPSLSSQLKSRSLACWVELIEGRMEAYGVASGGCLWRSLCQG